MRSTSTLAMALLVATALRVGAMSEAEITNRLATAGVMADGHVLDGEGRITLNLARSAISDLSFLQGLPVWKLNLYQNPVYDLAPLKSIPIKWLAINRTLVTDLTPLEGMTLEAIFLHEEFVITGMDALRKMQTLRLINGRPAAQFWKQYDAGRIPRLGTELLNIVEAKKRLSVQSPEELSQSLWIGIRLWVGSHHEANTEPNEASQDTSLRADPER